MSDDLVQFHARYMARDPQYVVARQLLEVREGAKMTRGQLGKLLHVKAQDIAIVEEETPRAHRIAGGSLEGFAASERITSRADFF